MPDFFDNISPQKADEAATAQEPAEVARPIETVAKELGGAYWTSIPASATSQAFEGPGWALAALMAGNKLEPGHPITKSELERLGKEAGSHSFGHSAHPPKKKA